MAGEFIIKHGSIISGSLQVTGGITGSFGGSATSADTASYVNPLVQDVIITGSLISPSITGSLLGTGSYVLEALSASYAPSTPAFPYTGSAEITGSLIVDSGIALSGSMVVTAGAISTVSTGTTNGTSGFKVQNATPEVLFEAKDDGELNINTTKYSNNGVLTNNGGIVEEVAGYTGIININTTPPIAIDVQNGIIVNVT